MLTLDLAVATHKPTGIERLAALIPPETEGISYVVSWQNHQNYPIPEKLQHRCDVRVYRFDSSGQSNNRNNAIDNCNGDIILHADDDVSYNLDGLQSLRHVFEQHPEIDLATFETIQIPPKYFPSSTVNLSKKWPKNYYVGAIEIAFRRATAGDMRCCPEFGLASPRMHGGEDELFVFSAIKRNLNCCFFPITIGMHPDVSTGTKAILTNENLRSIGCVISLMNPLTAALRIPLKAYRVFKKGQASFWRAIRYITSGALDAPGVLKRNHRYLW